MSHHVFNAVTRLLHCVPGLLAAGVLFCLGMAVSEFFAQAADQLVTVQSTVAGK